MPHLLNLLPHAVAQPQDTVATGTVSHIQPAPARFSDPLYVVIDGWSTEHYVTVTRWAAIHGTALPQPGAEVHLEKSGDGDWVATWWAGSQSPAVPMPFCNKLTNYLLA